MLDWISRNSDFLNIGLSAAMLGVWIAYLQIFASSYRRQTRANILVNMGGGTGLDTRCLVSNMSSGPIYLQSILIEIGFGDHTVTRSVTETEGFEQWEKPTDLDLWTRQGPLHPGEVRDMGSFGVMLDHALRSQAGGRDPDPALRDRMEGLSVRIIAVYGSEDLPIAAERSFAVVRLGERVELSPMSAKAHQVRSSSRRRKLRRMMEADLRDERNRAREQG